MVVRPDESRVEGGAMEFGIFSQMHVPPWDDEHARYLRELEVSLAVEAAGFKYDWSPEHHFLTNYSHQPAPEVYLSWAAARTKRIHIGTAIVNITAAVNHPARVAERIAVMDHLSDGSRVEFFTQVFFGWLDSIPRPKGFPKEGPVPKLPPPTPAELKKGLE